VRARYRPKRNMTTPPLPTMKSHTIRLIVATTIGVGVMLLLLMMAVRYAQRDWSKKNQRASASRWHTTQANETEAAQDTEFSEGWDYEFQPLATQRELDRLAVGRGGPNGWLLLGRALSDRTEPRTVRASLYMAMATEGETAKIKNDLGAVCLQQKSLRQAIAQFRAVEQIQPGFAPARYNLALCAISGRQPALAIRLLGQYLAQRPEDTSALRLQAALLSQFGRPEEALRMLENFLMSQSADEPLFLEAATLAARLGQIGNAIRYLETSMQGNSIRTVIQTYQSPAFREIRLSDEGEALTARLANKARATFSTAVPPENIHPLRSTAPEAKVH